MSLLLNLIKLRNGVSKRVLTLWVTWWVSSKRHEQLTLREYPGSHPVFARICVAHILSFLCLLLCFVCLLSVSCVLCLVLCLVSCSVFCVLFCVLCLVLYLVLCLVSCSVSCVLFCVLCLVCPMLPVSIDCPFLIAPSIFSCVYFNIKLRTSLRISVVYFSR